MDQGFHIPILHTVATLDLVTLCPDMADYFTTLPMHRVYTNWSYRYKVARKEDSGSGFLEGNIDVLILEVRVHWRPKGRSEQKELHSAKAQRYDLLGKL